MIHGKKVVSLCLSHIDEMTSNALISELGKCLCEQGAKLFIYNTCSDLYKDDITALGDSTVFNLIDYDVTDALVIHIEKIKSEDEIQKLIDSAHAHGKPVFLIGGYHDGCINVGFDYEKGFELVVRHVIEDHGISDAHFMAGIKDNWFSDRRKDIFRRVLEENGHKYSEDMVSYGDFWSVPAVAATEKLIAENRVPRAIICANDSMAMAVCGCLQEHGYRIPDQVVVTGFDGIDEIEMASPRITSGECRYEDIARKICELLPDALNGKIKSGDYQTTPRMIIWGSCGCPDDKLINISGRFSAIWESYGRFMGEEQALSKLGARIQVAPTVEDAAKEIANGSAGLIYNMCCLLKNECIDKTQNPLVTDTLNNYGESMFVLWDADFPDEPPHPGFRTKDITPHLENKMDSPYPVIISALHFLNVPLGYVVFTFWSFEHVNLVKIPQIVSALNTAIGGMRNTRHQKYLNERIEENYRTDALTGLYNRRGFSALYDKLTHSMCEYEVLTFILVDLDGLKTINDKYGHDEGDNAISKVADAMLTIFPPDVICCRFGGDEMAAVTKMALGEDSIRKAFNEYFDKYNSTSGKPYKVSASIGIYHSTPEDSLDFEALLKKADVLMYADKVARKAQRRD